MLTKDSNPQKTEGHGGNGSVESNSSKVVALRTGQKITVFDCHWSGDESILNVYLFDENGIDVELPREHVEAVINTVHGEEVFCDE